MVKPESLAVPVPRRSRTRRCSVFSFELSDWKAESFHSLPSATFFFFNIFGLVCVIMSLKMVPMPCAEEISSIPKCKRAVMGLPEKTRTFDKLSSGRRYRAAGHGCSKLRSP